MNIKKTMVYYYYNNYKGLWLSGKGDLVRADRYNSWVRLEVDMFGKSKIIKVNNNRVYETEKEANISLQMEKDGWIPLAEHRKAIGGV